MLDFRLISKSCFDCLTQSLFPCFQNNLHILRLSNAHTFGQISEILNKTDLSRNTQLESLEFDLIKPDELSRYFLVIHPLLKHLWRLSLTFDEHDQVTEKLLKDHIFIPSNQSQSLKSCFITGITFDFSKLVGKKPNKNLRELTLTLSTINDLLILFRVVPQLEILTCTIHDSTYNQSTTNIQSLDSLTILTLTIKKPILFKNLRKILMPHNKLKQISLRIILYDEVKLTK